MIFSEKLRLENCAKWCKGVHCVDLGESFPTSIYLKKSASIQPRTSPSKFGGKLFNIHSPPYWLDARWYGYFGPATPRTVKIGVVVVLNRRPVLRRRSPEARGRSPRRTGGGRCRGPPTRRGSPPRSPAD